MSEAEKKPVKSRRGQVDVAPAAARKKRAEAKAPAVGTASRAPVTPEGRWEEARSLMPQSPEAQRILRERAAILARKEEAADEDTEREAFIRFRLGFSEQYGIPHRYAVEVLEPGDITRVPCTPPSIIGIVNRRGDLLTILDLKHFFQMEDREYADAARVIVVSGSGMTLGILADAVEGEDHFDLSRLAEPLPSDGVLNLRHVKGIHRGKVTILDMDALLGDADLTVNHRGG